MQSIINNAINNAINHHQCNQTHITKQTNTQVLSLRGGGFKGIKTVKGKDKGIRIQELKHALKHRGSQMVQYQKENTNAIGLIQTKLISFEQNIIAGGAIFKSLKTLDKASLMRIFESLTASGNNDAKIIMVAKMLFKVEFEALANLKAEVENAEAHKQTKQKQNKNKTNKPTNQAAANISTALAFNQTYFNELSGQFDMKLFAKHIMKAMDPALAMEEDGEELEG